MPSDKQTEALYQDIGSLEMTMNADKTVRQKFDTNRLGFDLLSKTEVIYINLHSHHSLVCNRLLALA